MLEILLFAAASHQLTTPRLLFRRANTGRFKDHITILIENDESADLSCPVDFGAAVNDLTDQSAATASTATGYHSAPLQLNNAL